MIRSMRKRLQLEQKRKIPDHTNKEKPREPSQPEEQAKTESGRSQNNAQGPTDQRSKQTEIRMTQRKLKKGKGNETCSGVI